MRIVVLGSSGRLGRKTVQTLIRAGHEVVPVDIRPCDLPDAPPTRIIDLQDGEQLVEAMRGAEAICHFANHPGLSANRPLVGFRNNVSVTFNVFHAAELAGIKRIVSASSVQVYGCVAHGESDGRVIVAPPRYLPIDEDHPLQPTIPYSLTKAFCEYAADTFSRRRPDLTVWSLRFTAVIPANSQESAADLKFRSIAGRYPQASLYSWVSDEDAARATMLCCLTERPGHTPLNVVSPRSVGPWSKEALQQAYGCVPEFRETLKPEDSLVSGRRAQQLLGFRASEG